ncbi:hypothetical protein DFH06DRAFT_1153210 [Mycena polygramma]|nr:hypothetical protein DFH06DRAFT_1153210 [Mycena polygramma]
MSNDGPASAVPTSTTGTSQFASAASQPGDENGGGLHENPRPVPRVKVHIDAAGVPYMLDPATGQHYDVSDDETVLPHIRGPTSSQQGSPRPSGTTLNSTPSEESDVTTSTDPPLTSESLLAALITDVRTAELTDDQLRRFNTIRAMLSLGRDSLLTTTALVAGQDLTIAGLAGSVRALRDEMANRIEELSDSVMNSGARIASTLDNNIRILRATGTTEESLAQLVASVNSRRAHPIQAIAMPPVRDLPPHMPKDMGNVQAEVDRTLSPRQAHESDEDWHRRGNSNFARRSRAAQSFQQSGPQDGPTDTVPPVSILKTTRFVDNSSISSAGARFDGTGPRIGVNTTPLGYNQSPSGYITSSPTPDTPATAFEIHMLEKATQITQLIQRQLGVALEAAPRVPKMKDPPLYNGEDDNALFMNWLGALCTYLEGYSMGGPKYDTHRLLYLKQALGIDSLRWFRSEVDPTNRESDIPREFDAIVRAMYQRFVTSSTAIRASKEYDAVHELRRTAGDMREPPSEFSMRQHFMRLIPTDVHNELIKHGLFPEYTAMTTLKNHARTTIEGKAPMRGGATTVAAPGATPARTSGQTARTRSGTARGPVRASTTQAPALTSRPVTSASPRAPYTTARAGPVIGPTLKSSKTCFGCGIVGHIASDPVCPKYNESASHRPRPVAHLHAQRVVTSYASGQEDGDEEPEELEYLTEPAEYEDPEEVEGVYANYEGSQYDADDDLDDFPADHGADEEDPNEAPEIDDILGEGEGEVEMRSGAMRVRQHYSLRIEATSTEEGEETRPTQRATDRPLPNIRYMFLDAGRADMVNAGYPEWSAAAEATREPVSRISLHSHDSLMVEFTERHGGGPHFGSTSIQLSAIAAIGHEERARDTWMGVVNAQPTMAIGYSNTYLRTTAVNLENLNLEFRQLERRLNDTLQDLDEVMRLRNVARAYITGLHDRPSGSDSRTTDVLQTAAATNSRLIEDIALSICLFERRLDWARSMLNAVGEELTYRLLAREDYQRGIHIPVEVDRVATSAPTSPTPPPPSEPPSYPGSPHESDNYYAVEEHPVLSRVPNFDVSDEAEAAAGEEIGLVIDISDSPEADESAQLDDIEASTPDSAVVISDSPVSGTMGLDESLDAAPPHTDPEIILRSVVVHTALQAEHLTTFVEADGQLRVERSELPALHPRHPSFRERHRSALRTAIYERALERGVLTSEMQSWAEEEARPERNDAGEIICDVDGFPDTEPNLFPGLVYHEGLASQGPDADDEGAWPGFRLQMLSNRVEHIATSGR